MASDNDHDAELGREERLVEVLDAFLRAVESGRAPDRHDWLGQYPDLAGELERFLDEQEHLMRLTKPLRPLAAAAEIAVALAQTAADHSLSRDGPPKLTPAIPTESAMFRDFGDYELIEPVAAGGMGTVFKARQRSLNRLVALKLIRGGLMATGEALQRFRQEAEAVARLDHPNIVPIYDVGEHAGFHYFSMKLVDGGNLTLRVAEFSADPCSAARLVAAVARAIHHAHERGILHRDLKPSNILLDEQGQPHVSDFGLAKRVEDDGELTQSGAILGTPSYMAPEQASGHRSAITTATDVYGLGAVLYALLTGRPPFQADSVLETIEKVKLHEPDPPSGVNRRVNRDLQTICLKCLEKDPERRYRTAQDLADDLERWVRGVPIAARRARLVEQAWRWCRRNPRATAVLVAMTALAFIATVGFVFALNARDAVAQVNRDLLKRQRLFERGQYVADIRQAAFFVESNKLSDALDVLARHHLAPGPNDPRGFEWYYLWRLCHPGGRTLRGHLGDVYHAEFSPDGKVLATSGKDHTVRLWDVATEEPPRVLAGHTAEVNFVTFAPDGRTLATASADQTIKLWDPATGRPRQTLSGHHAEVVSVLFTPDGRRLVSCDRDERVIVWDPATGGDKFAFRVREGLDGAMAISPNGTTLAVGGLRGAGLFDLASGREKLVLDEGASPVSCVAFFGSGGHLYLEATGGRKVRVWDVERGKLVYVSEEHGSVLYSMAIDRDVSFKARADDHGLVIIVDGSARHRGTIPTGQGRIWCATFAPAGRILATASQDGTVKLWDVTRDTDRQSVLLGPSADVVHSAVVSPEARILWACGSTAERHESIFIWDSLKLRFATKQQFPIASRIDQAEISRDGTTVALVGTDMSCQVWDLKTGRSRISIKDCTGGYRVQLSPHGNWLAALTGPRDQSRIRVWNTENGLESLVGDPGQIALWVFSPDERTLAVEYSSSGSPALVDLVSGRTSRASRRGHAGAIQALEFSRDGKMLATGGLDRSIKLWDVDTLEDRPTLRGLKGHALLLCFSPDGKQLASCDTDKVVTLWDIPAGEPSFSLGPCIHSVKHLQFSPDGSTLVNLGIDHTGCLLMYLWHAPRKN
jgi:WD40 repeat protein